MQTAEPALLGAFEQGPKEVELVLKQRSLPAVDQVQFLGRRGSSIRTNTGSLGSTLALMFVAAQPSVPLGDDVAARIAVLPRNQSFHDATTNASDSSSRRVLCLKVLGQWVGRDVNADTTDQNLLSAIQYNLKQGLAQAEKILQQPQAPIQSTLLSMLVVGKLGDKVQLPAIGNYLNDHHVFQTFGTVNQPMQAQVCDLALVVTIKLNGQDPKSFGFPRVDVGEQLIRDFQSIAFRNDTERTAAFDKWEAWQKTQKGEPGEKTAGKPSGKKPE